MCSAGGEDRGGAGPVVTETNRDKQSWTWQEDGRQASTGKEAEEAVTLLPVRTLTIWQRLEG